MSRPAHLDEAVEVAKAARLANECPETRKAYRTAFNARAAWIHENDPPKTCGYGSRAGRRQAAARRRW